MPKRKIQDDGSQFQDEDGDEDEDHDEVELDGDEEEAPLLASVEEWSWIVKIQKEPKFKNSFSIVDLKKKDLKDAASSEKLKTHLAPDETFEFTDTVSVKHELRYPEVTSSKTEEKKEEEATNPDMVLVLFYKLKDGRGWVSDLSLAHPGRRAIRMQLVLSKTSLEAPEPDFINVRQFSLYTYFF